MTSRPMRPSEIAAHSNLGSWKKGMEFVGRARNLAQRLEGYEELIAHLNEISE